MGHLPYLKNPVQPPIQIEFLCASWLEPPHGLNALFEPSFDWKRWAWETDYWYSRAENAEHARFIQMNVYFGFLKCFIGPSFRLDDFLIESRFVTLAKLPKILSDLGKDRMLMCTEGEQRAWRAVGDYRMVNHQVLSTTLRNIQLSLVFLRITIDAIWGHLDYAGLRDFSSLDGGSNYILQDRLLTSGWCLYWVTEWSGNFPPLLRYHISGLSPWRSELRNLTGKTCTSRSCYCNNVNEDTYQSEHSPACAVDQCSFVGPDAWLVSDIVGRGKIPIVKISRYPKEAGNRFGNRKRRSADKASRHIASWSTNNANFDLEIVEYASRRQYVAISHVWSGGLGNFQENKLPRCQLEYLFWSVLDCQRYEAAYECGGVSC
jgi:hypothetical protein